MKAEILSVGTELLLGDIVNTNAQYLSQELASLGIEVYYQSTVGDNSNRLIEFYEQGFQRSDLIIVTGGLGPTEDDITKEVGAKYFNRKLYFDENVFKSIKKFFEILNTNMSNNNKKQAMIPEGALILKNNNGTAPGVIIEDNGKTLIMLPGPPAEMETMFKSEVIPYLKNKQDSVFISKTLKLCGIGESSAAQEIEDILKNQTNPSIAPYAKAGEMVFRITAKAKNEEEANKMIEPVSSKIYDKLGKYIYSDKDETLEQNIVNLMKEKYYSFAIAESCTGGLLSARFTNVPSISEIFIESVVTYSNESKIKRINVNPETLDKYGAVSSETAKEMAEGIANTSGANIGISITGIAGPDGGTQEKPVGLVYVGISINGETTVEKLNLSGDRQRVRMRAVSNTLTLLRDRLI